MWAVLCVGASCLKRRGLAVLVFACVVLSLTPPHPGGVDGRHTR